MLGLFNFAFKYDITNTLPASQNPRDIADAVIGIS
jgi:hypothetical protein